ncbi:MAG: hypothetical protein AAB131_01600 [Actinomycetota bacterium]
MTFSLPRFVAAAALLTLSSACSSASNSAQVGPDTLNAQPSPAADETSDEQRALFIVREERMQQCMARKGFEFRAASYVEPTYDDPAQIFGTDDVDYAREFGFLGLSEAAPTSSDTPSSSATEQVPDSMREGYSRALFGTIDDEVTFEVPGGQLVVPGGGCYVEALEGLFDDPLKYLQYQSVVTNLDNTAISFVLSDPGVVDAFRSYQTCMAQKGYADLVAPDEVPGIAASLVAQGESSTGTRVMELAVADATCNRDAGLRAVAMPKVAEERARSGEEYGALVDEYEQMLLAAVSRLPAGES